MWKCLYVWLLKWFVFNQKRRDEKMEMSQNVKLNSLFYQFVCDEVTKIHFQKKEFPTPVGIKLTDSTSKPVTMLCMFIVQSFVLLHTVLACIFFCAVVFIQFQYLVSSVCISCNFSSLICFPKWDNLFDV